LKSDNIFRRIANNPKDVDFEELNRLLLKYRFQRRTPGKGSSHFTYTHPKLEEILTIPFSRPVKAVYVKKAISAMQKIKQGGNTDERS